MRYGRLEPPGCRYQRVSTCAPASKNFENSSNSNEVPGFKGKLTLCMYFSFTQQTIKTTPLPTRHCEKHWRCTNELDITPVLRILLGVDVFVTDYNTKGFIYICCEMLYRFFVYISQVVFLFHSSHLSITKPHSSLCLLIFLHFFVNFIFQDYSVTYGHCPEITVYTSCCYFPSAAQLPSLWAENKKSLLSMLVEVSNPLLEANCQEYVQWKHLS